MGKSQSVGYISIPLAKNMRYPPCVSVNCHIVVLKFTLGNRLVKKRLVEKDTAHHHDQYGQNQCYLGSGPPTVIHDRVLLRAVPYEIPSDSNPAPTGWNR